MNLHDALLNRTLLGGSGGSGGGSGWDGNYVVESPNSVGFGEKSFYSNDYLRENLRSLEIRHCTSVGEEAFMRCSNLQTVRLNYVYDELSHYLGLDRSAFESCSSLKTVYIGNTRGVNNRTFAYCENLESVNIYPDDVNETDGSIGVEAFKYCKKLTKVRICPNAHSDIVCLIIWGYAFAHCESLEKISIENCTIIDEGAFIDCTNLSTVILRNNTEICNVDISAFVNTKILTAEGLPTGEGFVYVPTVLYEDYVSFLAAQAALIVGDATVAEQLVRAVLRKSEDYPEIVG